MVVLTQMSVKYQLAPGGMNEAAVGLITKDISVVTFE